MGLAVAGLAKLCVQMTQDDSIGSSVTTCAGRRDSEDLSVREEDTRNQWPARRDSTRFAKS